MAAKVLEKETKGQGKDFFDLAVAPEREPVGEEEYKQGEWWGRIQQARARGSFSPEDRVRAYYWNRCAIGEAFGLEELGPGGGAHGSGRAGEWLRSKGTAFWVQIARVGGGMPDEFNGAVQRDNFDVAEARLKDAYELAKEKGKRKRKP